MSNQISYAELRILLESNDTTDEELAPYFINSPSSHPYSPQLRLNEQLVEVPHQQRGMVTDFTVSFLNRWSQRRRLGTYKTKIANGFSGVRLIAEGDSWFQYPILRRDVIDCLDDEFAIYCTSAAGDTIANMTAGVDDLTTLIDEQKPHGFLFSGGGNDIAGQPLVSYLSGGANGSGTPRDYLSPAFSRFLSGLDKRLTEFFNRLGAHQSDLPIFCHGYDWPFPQSGGRWLFPAMEQHAIPHEMRVPILKLMIDSYYHILEHVVATTTARVILIDCRGMVGGQSAWYDELHPLDDGYARIADKFRQAIHKQIDVPGLSMARTTGTPVINTASNSVAPPPTPAREMTLIWYPRDDATGVRRTSKILPVGATVSVGRDRLNEIMIDDNRVSRHHAKLVFHQDGVVVEDLGSTNGTLIAGQLVTRAQWRPGDSLEIGIYRFELEPVSATNAAPHASDPISTATTLEEIRGLTPAIVEQSEEELRYLDLELVSGNIVNVATTAYVIGIFEHVKPSGSAREIDELLGHRLSSLVQARIFGCRQGEISLLPTPQQRSLSEMIVFAGLGDIGSFTPVVIETVAENLARVTSLAKVDELVCVPIGLDTGCTVAQFVKHFVKGFLNGLKSGDPNEDFFSLKICEIDNERYQSLAGEISSLFANGYFKERGFDVQIRQTSVSKLSFVDPNSPKNRSEINPIYLQATSPQPGQYDYFLLGAGHGGAIETVTTVLDPSLGAQMQEILANPGSFDEELGTQLANYFLPSALQQMINAKLEKTSRTHLVILHDKVSSAIPWEALYLDGKSPALKTGVSRTYRTDRSERSAGQTSLPRDARLRMLVVQNPTGDLPGALDEGLALSRFFQQQSGSVKILDGANATRRNLLQELTHHRYDILHYAGHADYDETDPGQSGLLCHDGMLVSGDLAAIANMPQLVFLNGCESGRLRSMPAPQQGTNPAHKLLVNISLAERLLMKGVPNFIGTYWDVGDRAAMVFAEKFYKALLSGKPIGLAMQGGRQATQEIAGRDWANYQHFGDPTYRLRQP